jgi:hypothetical protein
MGDGDELRKFVATPRRRRDLIEWLRQQPGTDHWQEDDWRQRCSDDFSTTACALCALAKEGVWPADRWREALQAWSEEKLLKRSWRYMAPAVAEAPNQVLQDLVHSVSWWLQNIAKTFEGQEARFFSLAGRILALDYQDDANSDEPVMRAINHPVGLVTEALLRWWYRRSLKDGQGLSEEIKPIFTELCDARMDKFRHGRVVLAAHFIALFRVDGQWTTQSLLPLFDWQHSEAEARSVWEGFLWSPRLYRPLMEVLKPAFLDTAHHYAALGEHRRQYASLLTFAALDRGDTFTVAELAGATHALPPDGLYETAQTLARALEGAGDQRTDYWTNRITPYLQAIWPKTRNNGSPAIAESLVSAISAAAMSVAILATSFGWALAAETTDKAPARVEATIDAKIKKITLTPKAAERLGILIDEVRADPSGRLIVPYASVLYDLSGKTWVYISAEPLTFVRGPVEIDTIKGDNVYLSDGPPVGTKVLAAGVPQVFGAEAKVGH